MNEKIKRIRALYVAFFLVLTFFGLSATSCTSTIDPNTTMVRFSLRGNEKKEVTLYGKKYVFEITKIRDTRCLSSQAGYIAAGFGVNLSVKSIITSEIKNIELFTIGLCAKSDTTAIFDTITDAIKIGQIDGFKVGLFDASPHQNESLYQTFPIADYQLTLITKKQ